MSKILKHWLAWQKSAPVLSGYFLMGLLASIGLALHLLTQSRELTIPDRQINHSIDTVIPEGWTLVPVEIINSEALDQVLGNIGLVSLYKPSREKANKSQLVVTKVNLLRAPKNPSLFSVLIPFGEAPSLLQHGTEFYVSILKPNVSGPIFEKPKIKKQNTRVFIETIGE